MKKSIMFLIAFMMALSAITIVNAEPNFFVKVTPLTSAISIDDVAKYTITIINNNTFDDTYTFFMKDSDWTVGTEPTTDYWNGLSVPREGTEQTTLRLSTNQNFPVGMRPGIQLIMKSKKTGEEVSAVLNVEILPRTKFPLDITTKIASSAPYYIDPREKVSIKVNIKNNNGARYSNLQVSLIGKYISRNVDIALLPYENKVAEFTLDFDKLTAPGKDTLTLELRRDGKLIGSDHKDIEIVEYSEPFKRSDSITKSFLKTTTTINLENDGNVVKQQTISFPVTAFQKYFTTSVPSAQYSKETGYSWDILLKSAESTQIVVVKNMAPLWYIAIFIIAYLITYLILRSPLVVRKEISSVVQSEGGISEIKITVKIKNRGREQKRDVTLIERIPEITSLMPEKDAVKPTKVYHYSRGSVLEWRFAVIEPGEERIVSYRLKSRLVIMGGMKLKPSIIKFDKRKAYSASANAYTP